MEIWMDFPFQKLPDSHTSVNLLKPENVFLKKGIKKLNHNKVELL
jgi:hypothetical protein